MTPKELAKPRQQKKMHAAPAATSQAWRPPSGAGETSSSAFSLQGVEGLGSEMKSLGCSMFCCGECLGDMVQSCLILKVQGNPGIGQTYDE